MYKGQVRGKVEYDISGESGGHFMAFNTKPSLMLKVMSFYSCHKTYAKRILYRRNTIRIFSFKRTSLAIDFQGGFEGGQTEGRETAQ